MWKLGCVQFASVTILWSLLLSKMIWLLLNGSVVIATVGTTSTVQNWKILTIPSHVSNSSWNVYPYDEWRRRKILVFWRDAVWAKIWKKCNFGKLHCLPQSTAKKSTFLDIFSNGVGPNRPEEWIKYFKKPFILVFEAILQPHSYVRWRVIAVQFINEA